VRGRLQQRQLARMLAVWNDLARRHGWPATHPRNAFSGCDFVGRYDVRGDHPRLILDTAHNAHALRRVLEQFGSEGERPGRVIVFASVHGKEIEPVLGRLTEVAASVLVCAPDWYRALPPGSLRDRIEAAATGPASVEAHASVREALERARALRPDSVLVTGSNFLVAEAMDRLGMDELEDPARLWPDDAPLRRRPRIGEEAL
jgi:dihydrofolate synthase/folylpolyglutamate synthase